MDWLVAVILAVAVGYVFLHPSDWLENVQVLAGFIAVVIAAFWYYKRAKKGPKGRWKF